MASISRLCQQSSAPNGGPKNGKTAVSQGHSLTCTTIPYSNILCGAWWVGGNNRNFFLCLQPYRVYQRAGQRAIDDSLTPGPQWRSYIGEWEAGGEREAVLLASTGDAAPDRISLDPRYQLTMDFLRLLDIILKSPNFVKKPGGIHSQLSTVFAPKQNCINVVSSRLNYQYGVCRMITVQYITVYSTGSYWRT